LILYEIVWAGIRDNGEVKRRMKTAIDRKSRPTVDGIPQLAKTLIEACWQERPEDRPSFVQIMEILFRKNFEIVDDVDTEEVNAFYQWIERETGNRTSR
jgi:hypothetical protein